MYEMDLFCFVGVNTSHCLLFLLFIIITEGWYHHPSPLRHDQLFGGGLAVNRGFTNFIVYRTALVSKSIYCHSRV
jgi:hypothetical protein